MPWAAGWSMVGAGSDLSSPTHPPTSAQDRGHGCSFPLGQHPPEAVLRQRWQALDLKGKPCTLAFWFLFFFVCSLHFLSCCVAPFRAGDEGRTGRTGRLLQPARTP